MASRFRGYVGYGTIQDGIAWGGMFCAGPENVVQCQNWTFAGCVTVGTEVGVFDRRNPRLRFEVLQYI